MTDPGRQQLPGDNEIHLWEISLADTDLDLPELLSSEEIARYGRISHEQLRKRYLRSRAAMRLILSSYLDVGASQISYRHNENGKPELDLGDEISPPKFNLSHSADDCLLAVSSTTDLGVDIERMLPGRDYMALARRFFTAVELRILESEARDELFYRMWVLKEASVKARGMKLLGGLDRFECTLLNDGTVAVSDRKTQGDEGAWYCRQWQPGNNTVAAVIAHTADAVCIDRSLS